VKAAAKANRAAGGWVAPNPVPPLTTVDKNAKKWSLEAG